MATTIYCNCMIQSTIGGHPLKMENSIMETIRKCMKNTVENKLDPCSDCRFKTGGIVKIINSKEEYAVVLERFGELFEMDSKGDLVPGSKEDQEHTELIDIMDKYDEIYFETLVDDSEWENNGVEIYKGDCLELMKDIIDNSVDMILCDLPYGTTACDWDTVIPLESLWEQYYRVIKGDGAIVLTASQPFTSKLVMSNIKMFKCNWIWKKSRATLYQHAKRRPMKGFEDVVCFGKCSTYNPQGIYEVNKKNKRGSGGGTFGNNWKSSNEYITTHSGYPNGIIEVHNEGNTVHPTQKPVALFEYLIKTYTNEGDLVLDNCMGSGTTGVACVQTGRKFIGIEINKEYYNISKERISNAQLQIRMKI